MGLFAQSSTEKRELIFNNSGNKIWGEVYIPSTSNSKKKFPTIIFAHGYNSSANSVRGYAQAFAKEGYVTYSFDFPGGSSYSRSDGKSTEMSIFTEQRDLEFVLDALKKEDFVDPEKVFLFGESQGGMVSTMVATDRPNDIAGLFMIFPAYVIGDDASRSYKSIDEVPEVVNFMGLRIGKEYYKGLFNFDIYSKMGNFKKDVLIVHGDRDGLVDISYSEKAIKYFPSATLKVVKGGGHGFYGSGENIAIDYILEYLRTH